MSFCCLSKMSRLAFMSPVSLLEKMSDVARWMHARIYVSSVGMGLWFYNLAFLKVAHFLILELTILPRKRNDFTPFLCTAAFTMINCNFVTQILCKIPSYRVSPKWCNTQLFSVNSDYIRGAFDNFQPKFFQHVIKYFEEILCVQISHIQKRKGMWDFVFLQSLKIGILFSRNLQYYSLLWFFSIQI